MSNINECGLIGKIQKFISRYGSTAFILLTIFPLVLVITNTVRLFRSLWASRILANGRWSEYNRFRPQNGLNSLCYWTQALNLDRNGRNGINQFVSTGDYHSGYDWWPCSLTSYYLSWRLGAMLPLLCMFGWIGFHFNWIGYQGIGADIVLIVLAAALVSSYFYAGTFVFLNYNAFGWLFMPLGIYGLITGNYWLASFAWLAASIGSITVVFIAGWLTLAFMLLQGSVLPVLTLLPATIKLASHFSYAPNFKEAVFRVASSIGLNSVSNNIVKYKRAQRGKIFSVPSIYFLVSWGIFAVLLNEAHQREFVLMVATILLLWVMNASIARFADDQSVYMAMFSVATVSLILNPSILLFCAYWIAVSPPPFLIGASSIIDKPLMPRSYVPFRIQGLIDRCTHFITCTPPLSRILLVLDDPKSDYDKLFDGYRVIYELAFYVGNLNKMLIFPDWWAVFENNTTSSPGFWGRTPEAVLENAKRWNADHVLIYQEMSTSLEDQWTKAGFVELSNMDWGELLHTHLNGEPCWEGGVVAPKWFLLKVPNLARFTQAF
jgi:hypothetical protein